MAQQMMHVAFLLLVLTSVVSGRGLHHGGHHGRRHRHHAMPPSSMPFADATGVSIALPPSASFHGFQQVPQHYAMAPFVKNSLQGPSPAPSHVDEGSVFAGLGSPQASPPVSGAKDLIGKVLGALAPIIGPAKEELERQGGLKEASDAIHNVISSSGVDVKGVISKVLDAASPTSGSAEDATKEAASGLDKIFAAAAASDKKQETTSGAFSAMRSSSLAGTMAIVVATACFML